MKTRQVSAVIIARNEERYIERCLSSLTWADEIVLVDGGSTDRTLEISRDSSKSWIGKLKLVERKWSGFKDQRNYAIRSASYDWVLVVDADEECSTELAQKIRSILAEEDPHRYYKVKRVEYFLGKPIRYGIWNPSYQDRFFHREGIEYVNEVHEYPPFPKTPERIHEPLHHAPDFSPDRFLDKMNRYTTIEAQDRVARGARTNWFRMLAAFPAMFYKNYVYYKAYKDGFHGFTISILEGISRAVRHVKIWQLTRATAKKST
jgi:glycosyltransferase involved in cell wall biosynthesis